MAGKYAAITAKLPRYENPDVAYRDKVNDRKAELVKKPSKAIEEGQVVDVAPVHPLGDDDALLKVVETHTQEAINHLNDALALLNQSLQGRQTPAIVGRFYKAIRIMKDTMAEQEYEVNLSIAAFESLIADIYEREDLSHVKMTTGGSVGVRWEPYSKVVNRDDYREWAINTDLRRSLAVPWQTTNSMVKDLLISGSPLPPGIEATAKPIVVLYKN